jgi:type II secretory pathway pseudopilin PulG
MSRRFRFPLVEILIVATIIAGLSALLLPATQSARELARLNARRAAQSQAMPAAKVASAGEDRLKARYAGFAAVPASPRKIIYEAEIGLVVKKVADTETNLHTLLKQFDGYIAESNVDRVEGEELTGRWKVRVPVNHFDSFVEQLARLGVAETRRQTAQDVTEEFVDLEAQIANKKKLEERIVALLKDTSGKIKDVIEVERELARVRGEVEQMEGRLRYLTNRTDFTTVAISAREEENYVPPAAPTFVDRIAQAWNMSLVAMRGVGEQLVVAAVYVFPWLAVAMVIVIPVFLIVRRKLAAKPVTARL